MSTTTATLPDFIDIISAKRTQRIVGFSAKAKLLGKAGAAGAVYEHPELSTDAIKLYKDPKRAQEHAAKIQAMIDATPAEVQTRSGVVQMAWPSANVLVDGQFAGFVMPKIDLGKAWQLDLVMRPELRRRFKISERMDLRLTASRNLASLLQALHRLNHYFIDLKPQNIFVYRDDAGDSAGYVALIDCDGYQIQGRDGQRFDAEFATLEFLSPDVTDKDGGFDRARINHLADVQDDFALAVILFQLLNNNLHPMQGKETGESNVPGSLAERLRQGGEFYPYALDKPNPLIAPMDESVHRWFDPELRRLFDQAFAGTGRPPRPREWLEIFDRLLQPEYECEAASDHWKLSRICGACAILKPETVAQAQGEQIALRQRNQSSGGSAESQPSRLNRPPTSQAKGRWGMKQVAGLGIAGVFLGWCVYAGVIRQPNLTVPQPQTSAGSADVGTPALSAGVVPTQPSNSGSDQSADGTASVTSPTSNADAPPNVPAAQVPSGNVTSQQGAPSAGVATIPSPTVPPTPSPTPTGPAPTMVPGNDNSLSLSTPGTTELSPPVLPSNETEESALGLSLMQREEIQLGLQVENLYNGPLDGAFGPSTRSAITQYQANENWPQTGYLDETLATNLMQIAAQSNVSLPPPPRARRSSVATPALPPPPSTVTPSVPADNATTDQQLRNSWLGN